MERKVVAEAYMVCPECPGIGQLSPIEHSRECMGPQKIGEIAVCGKTLPPKSAKELYPQLWERDD